MTIDFSKSIARGHLVTNKTSLFDRLEDPIFYLTYLILVLLLVPLPIYMLTTAYLINDLGVFTTIFGGVQLIFGLYLIFCLNNWKRLTKIEGTDINANKEAFLQTINAYFPGLEYSWDGDILIASKPYNYWRMKYGIEVVAIFSYKDIYVNILTTFRGPIPWTAYSNIDKSNELGRLIKEKFRYHQTPHNTVYSPWRGYNKF